MPSSLPKLITPRGAAALNSIEPESIYATFNAPAVDDYHRGILVTAPKVMTKQDTLNKRGSVGTLYHAVFCMKSETWNLEGREVNNIEKAKSLVLLYKIGSAMIKPEWEEAPDKWSLLIDNCLRAEVILSPDPMTRNDDLIQRLGNPDLKGYSCVAWSVDALEVLKRHGLINLKEGMDAEQTLQYARELAGPKDGRKGVGRDHGVIRVVDERLGI